MELEYFREVKPYSSYVLGGDIGGTNSILGIAGITEGRVTPLFSARFRTQEMESLIPAIEETLDYAKRKHNIETDDSCFGVAGMVSQKKDYCKLTNAPWDVDSEEIKQKTNLRSAKLLNDFEAIGYGINVITDEDVMRIKESPRNTDETKALMGAGTGVGKSILLHRNGTYIPLPSEGGHMDFPVQDRFELELIDFIKGYRGVNKVSYEQVVSGRGIESIYMFLKSMYGRTECTKEIEDAEDKVPVIAKHKKTDPACKETFRLYARFYGRCARNFVLDYVPRGGLYIAGGIAPRHREIFTTSEFYDEFHNCDSQRKILESIPIYIVLNTKTGLYGACFAAIF